MAASHQVPKGTFDILPGDEAARDLVASYSAILLEAAGYGRIETPAFEGTELFARGVGASTTSSTRRCSPSPTRVDAR